MTLQQIRDIMKQGAAMIGDNLLSLRKIKGKTQEEVASAIGVTRQALSKWENNESMPDIINCVSLADYYGVTVDDMINFSISEMKGFPVPPKGKHLFGVVTMGAKGQIVIPRKARELFNISPGDRIVVLGSDGEGIALIKEASLANLLHTTLKMKPIVD